MPLFSIENVLIWIIPFLVFGSDAVVNVRTQTVGAGPCVMLWVGSGRQLGVLLSLQMFSLVWQILTGNNFKLL